MLLVAHIARHGVADFFVAGKVPKIWKIAALLRFHRLHRAIFTLKKNALAVGFFHQRQTAAVVAQSRELLDETVFAHALERGQLGDFLIRQTHLSRPAAAGGAMLTFQKNRHTELLQFARNHASRARVFLGLRGHVRALEHRDMSRCQKRRHVAALHGKSGVEPMECFSLSTPRESFIE